MRITAVDHPDFADAKPGQELILRVFVESVSVDSLDVQSYGKPPVVLPGSRTVEMVYVQTERETT